VPEKILGSKSQAEIFQTGNGPETVASGNYGFVKPEHADFPPIVIIAVTNVCDLACIHCAHPVLVRSPGYKGTFMAPEVHSRIVEEVSQFKDRLWVFRYAADGEGMLHPNFLDFVKEAKDAGIGPVNLTTNAMTLTEDKARRLLEAPIDVIDVSLDAFSKEAYEKIRRKGKFEQVTGNLMRLIELRNELRAPTKIMTSIISQKEALDEVDDFVEFWGQHVDEVLVRGLNTDLGVVNASETYFKDIARWPCPQFWKRMTVNQHGDVRFCVEDWFNEGLVGNIMEQSLQEIWQGPLYQKFRDLHLSGRWGEMKMCQGCQDWQHMEWNHGFEKAINKVMDKS
jgi:radical SAM protein with 4Fe4S-binding SPASM domain